MWPQGQPTGINEPQILLMDEPFSALDVQTRTLMEDELLQLCSSLKTSVAFVTHDLEEAISLADRVCVITAGPGTVKGIYTIDLPRPRKVEEIRFEPRFAQLYHDIWACAHRHRGNGAVCQRGRKYDSRITNRAAVREFH
jgi:NitT/TauT family transport system ATP-binding protein